MTSGYGGLWISWTWPVTNPHAVAYVKLYRSTSSAVGTAAYLLRTQSDLVFDKSEVVSNTTYYYWIRFVSINGTEGDMIGPGSGQMKPTVDEVLALLQNMIRSSHLYTDLLSDITSIASLEGEVASERLNRIAGDLLGTQAWAALQADLDAVDTAVVSETTARVTANSAMVSQVSAILAQSNQNATLIGSESTARADADSAMGTRTNFITARLGLDEDPTSGTYGSYFAGTAINEVRVNLGYDATANPPSYAVNVTDINELNVDMNGANGIVQQTMSVVGLAPAASGGGTTATGAGLAAQWMVKTEVAQTAGKPARIAGFGLHNTGTSSIFIVSADKFAVAADNLTTGSGDPAIPFVVYTNDAGQSVIGMDAQVFIKEASITTAQIDDLSVTTAKIVDGNIINAKIGDTIQSNVFGVTATAAAGWRLSKSSGIEATAITIRDLNGNTILNSGGTVWDYVTGTSKPADGAEVNALGAQIKINYQSFTAANNGEIYVHGFNAAGVAADVNGYMFGIGTSAISHKETLVKGAIWTSGKTGWIMYAMSGIGFNHGGSFNKGAVVKKEGEQWYYDNNSSWATFTPNDWCWIIGSVVGSGSDAGGIVDGALISTPIHATRVNGFSELDKITSGNASTYIAKPGSRYIANC